MNFKLSKLGYSINLFTKYPINKSCSINANIKISLSLAALPIWCQDKEISESDSVDKAAKWPTNRKKYTTDKDKKCN